MQNSEYSLQKLPNTQEPSEILRPHYLSIDNLPKNLDIYFSGEYLTFVRLPRVYTNEELQKIYPQENQAAKELSDNMIPFIPGIKPNRGMIDIFDPRTNTSADTRGVEVLNLQTNPVQMHWLGENLEFGPDPNKLPGFYIKALDEIFGKLQIPKLIKDRLSQQPQYWQEVYNLLNSSSVENIRKLGQIFASKEFSGSPLYGGDKILIVVDSKRKAENLFLTLL